MSLFAAVGAMALARRLVLALACVLAALLALGAPALAGKLVDDEDMSDAVPPVAKTASKASNGGVARVKKASSGASLRAVEVPLAHALGAGGAFVPAGSVTAKAGFSTAHGAPALHLKALKVRRSALSEEEKAAFSALVAADGLYTVALPASLFAAEGEGGADAAAAAATGADVHGGRVLASVRARCLADAALQEHLVLHMDFAGAIAAVELSPPGADCSAGSDGAPPARWDFASTAAVKFPKIAPRLNPDAGTDGDESDPSAPGGGKSKGKKEPKTFMERYWVYLVAFGFVLLQNIIAPPPQQGGQGQGGGGGAAAGGSGGAAK